MLGGHLEVWGGVGGETGSKKEETYACLRAIHVGVLQKPLQYCKSIILQLKIDFFFKEKGKVYLRLVTENKLFANCCL